MVDFDKLNVGDYVWLDWDNVPKTTQVHNVTTLTPHNFNEDMFLLSDSVPRKIVRFGHCKSEFELEGIPNGTWSYYHLARWMYLGKDKDSFSDTIFLDIQKEVDIIIPEEV